MKNRKRDPAGTWQTEEEDTIRAKAGPGGPAAARAEDAAAAVSAGGAPLAADLRSYFEPRFGRDFSGVRVHTGAHAQEAASAIRARAFTLGRNIAFAAGEYRLGDPRGRQLIAHELTHVAQQSSGIGRAASEPVIRRWTQAGILQDLCGNNFGRITINRLQRDRLIIMSFRTAFDRWRHADGHRTENELPGLFAIRTLGGARSGCARDCGSAAASILSTRCSIGSTPQTQWPPHLKARSGRALRPSAITSCRAAGVSSGISASRWNVNERFIRSDVMGSSHYNPHGRTRRPTLRGRGQRDDTLAMPMTACAPAQRNDRGGRRGVRRHAHGRGH